jgi:hypothetical protein
VQGHHTAAAKSAAARQTTACPVQVLAQVMAQETGPKLLDSLKKAWENQETMVRWLSRFFNYLDRCDPSTLAQLPCSAQSGCLRQLQADIVVHKADLAPLRCIVNAGTT